MGTTRGFDGVPENHADTTEHRRMMARAINRLNGGKLNATFEATLRLGEATTEIADPRIAPTSVLLWMPRTASAAAAAPTIHVGVRGKGRAVLIHAAAAAADQDFTFLVLG
jgi:hypothetical protein